MHLEVASPFHRIVASPIGRLLLVGDGDVLVGLYTNEERWRSLLPSGGADDAKGTLAHVEEQLAQYFAGQRKAFEVRVRLDGTPFQQRVWSALTAIPYGETWSYAQLARAVDAPNGQRAVGAANGRNPISIIVPCHRVVGASGKLTGYGGGLPNKEALLALEARVQARDSPGQVLLGARPTRAD